MDKTQSSKMLHLLKNHEIYPFFWSERSKNTKNLKKATHKASLELHFLDLELLQAALNQPFSPVSDERLEALLFGSSTQPHYTGWTKKRMEKIAQHSGFSILNMAPSQDFLTQTKLSPINWNPTQAKWWRREQRLWTFRKNLRKKWGNLKGHIQHVLKRRHLQKNGLWLNLGAGEEQYPNYLKVDWDGQQDVYDNVVTLKKFAANSVERIYCNHVLEHIPPALVDPMLQRWQTILQPGGTIRARIPDAKQAVLTLNSEWHEVSNSTLDELELPHFLDKEATRSGILNDESAIQTIYGWSQSTPHTWDLSNQHKSLWTPELTKRRFETAGFVVDISQHLGTLHTLIVARKP